MEFNAEQIASFLSGTIEGNKDVTVNNFSKIENGKKNTISFLANPKYEQYIYDTQASIVLVNEDFKPERPIKTTLIRVENAYECLAKLLTLASKAKPRKKGIENPVHIDESATLGENLYIGAFAYIGENSKIGDNTQIYPQVYIADNVQIGSDCILYPGVKIYDNCVIGNNCILQAGCVIGGDGFGFAPNEDGQYDKIPQLGNVILEDFVEIGANTTIDRAVMESTIVHKGTKLDNLIQVAHNVEIGSNTVMAAQVGVAGSTKIGSNCMVGGQVGFAGHIDIANGTQIAAQAGISNSIKDVKTPYMGTPAIPIRNFAKSFALFKKFPELYKTMKKNSSDIEDLKK